MPFHIKKNKSLKYLIVGIIIASLIILIKEIILKPESLSLPEQSYFAREIKINFNLLENKTIKELLPFENISALEKIGREDPFRPY